MKDFFAYRESLTEGKLSTIEVNKRVDQLNKLSNKPPSPTNKELMKKLEWEIMNEKDYPSNSKRAPDSKFKSSNVYHIDVFSKEDLKVMGIKNKSQIKKNKTISSYNLGDSKMSADPDNSAPEIYINQFSSGLLLSQDKNHVFIEKMKISNRNAEDIYSWFITEV